MIIKKLTTAVKAGKTRGLKEMTKKIPTKNHPVVIQVPAAIHITP